MRTKKDISHSFENPARGSFVGFGSESAPLVTPTGGGWFEHTNFNIKWLPSQARLSKI